MNEMGEFDCPSIMAEVFASVSTARYLSVLHANSTYPLKSSRSSSPLRFYRSSVKSYHSSSDVAIVEDVNNRGSREYAEFWAARALVDSKLVLSNDRLCDITTHCGTPYQTSRALRFYCVIGDRNFVPYASFIRHPTFQSPSYGRQRRRRTVLARPGAWRNTVSTFTTDRNVWTVAGKCPSW